MEDFSFDADANVDDSRELIAPGNYQLRVEKAEVVTTKAGNGRLVKLGFAVLGPTCAGRWLFDQFVVEHTSEAAARIGKGKLSECSRALQLPKWSSVNELVGQVCEAKIGIVDDDFYGQKNEVKKYIVPASHKGAAASNPERDRHRNVAFEARGGALASVSGQKRPEPPAHVYDDTDVPF